ncbi:MAG: hypothetical protein ACLQGP_41075, partial [Isosphaeraceae bacterium]
MVGTLTKRHGGLFQIGRSGRRKDMNSKLYYNRSDDPERDTPEPCALLLTSVGGQQHHDAFDDKRH